MVSSIEIRFQEFCLFLFNSPKIFYIEIYSIQLNILNESFDVTIMHKLLPVFG